jgi:hypothetical protein
MIQLSPSIKNKLTVNLLEQRQLLATCPGVNGATQITPNFLFETTGKPTMDLSCTLDGPWAAASAPGDAIQLEWISALYSDGLDEFSMGLRGEVSAFIGGELSDNICSTAEVYTKPVAIPEGYCMKPIAGSLEAKLTPAGFKLTGISSNWTAVATGAEFKFNVDLSSLDTVFFGACSGVCPSSAELFDSLVGIKDQAPEFSTITDKPTEVPLTVTNVALNAGSPVNYYNPCKPFECQTEVNQAAILASIKNDPRFNG